MDTFKNELKEFFTPALPLWKAIVTFAKTSLGIAIGVLIVLWIVIRLTTFANHHQFYHKYKDLKGNYQVKEYHIQGHGYQGGGIMIRR